MNEQTKHRIETDLKRAITSAQPVSGGDINDAFFVTLNDGQKLFIKTNQNAPSGMFSCEAKGLAWLRETNALPTPKVISVGLADSSATSYLAVERLTSGPTAVDFHERLGDGLARLHRHSAASFGLDYNNFIATLPQDNRPCDTWPEFYALRRLEPQVKRAVDTRSAPIAWVSQFARLFERMPQLTGPEEPPARLHGDLWTGNIHTGPDGTPYLIDPAVYAGNREIDLAMLELFGELNPRMLAAYDNRYKRDPESADRTALYQLYPLLVHVNLFGGGYIDSVTKHLSRYLR